MTGAVNALAQGDETGAFTRFDQIGRTGPAGYRSLALIQAGNLRLAANKTGEAAGFYDRAAKAAPNTIFGDLARLRAAQALLDTAAFTDLRARLAPLIGENKPFNLAAREALALAKLRDGQASAARNDFSALTLTLGVSQAMRSRAQAAIALIDAGEGKLVGPAALAAAAVPPSAAILPGAEGSPAAAAPPGPGTAAAGAQAPAGAPMRRVRWAAALAAAAIGLVGLDLAACSTVSKVGSLARSTRKRRRRRYLASVFRSSR